MGMHFGIVAARTSWPELLAGLRALTGDFIELGPVTRLDGDRERDERGEPLVGGELDARAYLVDESLLLSSDLDLLTALSRNLGTTVVGCLGETVSGTCSWLVAEKGEVVRVYAHCVSAIREPFQLGTPLATEAAHPFEDIDGAGFFEALTLLGFDYQAWYERGTKTGYLYTCKEPDVPGPRPERPLGAAYQAHWKRFEIPKGQQPRPTVRVRRLADGSTAFDVVSEPPRPSLLARIKALFGGG